MWLLRVKYEPRKTWLSMVAVMKFHFFPMKLASHLCFGQHERSGHFKAFGSGQVLVELELVLQLQQLLTGKRGAGPPTLAQKTRLRARWGRESHSWNNSLIIYVQPTNPTAPLSASFSVGFYIKFWFILKRYTLLCGWFHVHILWPSLTTAALLQFIVDGEDKQKPRP